ncbi:hypothetical protein BJX99DRAFT_263353 [Aspergillus californicus]
MGTQKIVLISGRTEALDTKWLEPFSMESLKALPDTVGSVTPVQLDVTHRGSINSARTSIGSSFGHLDVLVNNAAIYLLNRDAAQQPVHDALRDCFETNVIGAATLTETFLPLLQRSANPRLVFVTSADGSLAHNSDPISPNWGTRASEYRVSKAALNMLLVQYHAKLEDVIVIGVDPGFSATNIMGDADLLRSMGAAEPDVSARFIASVVRGGKDDQADYFNSMGSYLRAARNLKTRFPCMTQFFSDWERFGPTKLPQMHPPGKSSSRCGVFEFVPDKQPEFVDLSDASHLRDYLDQMGPKSPCQNRLFLLEDLEEATLEMLGAALDIDPTVLADHSFSYHYSQNHTIPHRTLPSMINPAKSFTLRYYEIREIDQRYSDGQPGSQRTFARISRPIERWRDLAIMYRTAPLDVVRHNVSFWCDEVLPVHRPSARSGWNAILLVDPPISSHKAPDNGYYVLGKDRESGPWKAQLQQSKPYHGGYSDVQSEPGHSPSAPSQVSMFDDIIFYWLHAEKGEIDSVFDSCVNTTSFVQRIVASHWFCFLDLQFKTLSTLDLTSKSKRGDFAGAPMSTADWRAELTYYNDRLSLLGLLQRRLMWYKQETVLNLERLGFPAHGAQAKTPAAILAARQDLQAILYEMDRHESRVDNLVGVVTDSINLSSALRSSNEARFGLQLSIVGAIFFPVTLVCAIFSMGGDYLPGEPHFWIPWTVAVPLVAALIWMIWRTYRGHL